MSPLRVLSMSLIPLLRCTVLLSAVLLCAAATASAQALPAPSAELLAKLENIYKDIHANPELSM